MIFEEAEKAVNEWLRKNPKFRLILSDDSEKRFYFEMSESTASSHQFYVMFPTSGNGTLGIATEGDNEEFLMEAKRLCSSKANLSIEELLSCVGSSELSSGLLQSNKKPGKDGDDAEDELEEEEDDDFGNDYEYNEESDGEYSALTAKADSKMAAAVLDQEEYNWYASTGTNMATKRLFSDMEDFQASEEKFDVLGAPQDDNLYNKSVPMDSSRNVLHIAIDDVDTPVSLDKLAEVFSRYGKVTKIVMFGHNKSVHALIQYGDSNESREAKQSLNRQYLSDGQNRLFVEFSKLQNIEVKYNSNASRDYLNKDIAWNEFPSFDIASFLGKEMYNTNSSGATSDSAMQVPPTAVAVPAPTAAAILPPTAAAILPPTAAAILPPTAAAILPPTAVAVLPPTAVAVPRPTAAAVPPPTAAAIPLLIDRLPRHKYVPVKDRRPVVLVENLDERKITLDKNEIYGKVNRIKISSSLGNATALIEYEKYYSALDAKECLDGMMLWGKMLAVSPSEHLRIDPSCTIEEKYQDYSDSQNQRFMTDFDRDLAEVGPPSRILYLSRIPPLVTERGLTTIFGTCGRVTGFKFLEPYAKHERLRTALIEMATIEEGIDALMTLHSVPVTGGRVGISFTRRLLSY